MKNNFVGQVIVVAMSLAILGWIFLGKSGEALFLGALWSAANLWLIKQLVLQTFKQGKKNWMTIGLLAALKCPLFYFFGFFLLRHYFDRITYLVGGFSLLLFALILLAIKEKIKNRVPNDRLPS